MLVKSRVGVLRVGRAMANLRSPKGTNFLRGVTYCKLWAQENESFFCELGILTDWHFHFSDLECWPLPRATNLKTHFVS